ncbi:hypothetical protein KAR91_28090 [Candidatus Pacearchaeota archaeon]|nr:hypothetical protein [Candidatus Pacearchaeota archaeon]
MGGHCVDRFAASMSGKEEHGPDYVPDDLGLGPRGGKGDDMEFDYCLDCGLIQGDFPILNEDMTTFQTDEEE